VNQLGWGTLQGRRKMDKLSAMYNVYKGERGWKELSQIIEPASYRARHDHRLKLQNKVTRTNVGKYSFSIEQLGIGMHNQRRHSMLKVERASEGS
jgi:hypothetical protein